MPNKRVAIIGGGIGGLSCLHFLAKQGVIADLYEAENRIGGRIYTLQPSIELGAYVFHEQYYTLLEIIADMGLTEAIESKSLGRAGFLKNNQLILLNPKNLILSLFTRKLSLKDVRCLFKLLSISAKNYRDFFEFLKCYSQNTQTADIIEFAKKNHKIISWYQASFLNGKDNFTKDIFQYFISPVVRKLLFQPPGALNFLMGNAIFGAKTFKLKTLRGGLSTLLDKLFERYQRHIHLSSHVDSVTQDNDVFRININGQSKEYDKVIYATPKTRNTEYAKGSVTVVTGTLKPFFSQCDNLLLNDESGAVNGITKCDHDKYIIYSMDFPDENALHLDRFFSSYDIIYRKLYECVMPKSNATLFENNHSDKHKHNIFYVGDFLSPAMEVSAVTGKKVAREILGG